MEKCGPEIFFQKIFLLLLGLYYLKGGTSLALFRPSKSAWKIDVKKVSYLFFSRKIAKIVQEIIRSHSDGVLFLEKQIFPTKKSLKHGSGKIFLAPKPSK